ncbi:hypothetical protein [Protaetiibacter larvae]|uniref:Uncharacterized protein n=1 Tax=Protaetiibacter larvae TaxID=2592654 RepID=A0A5C1Y7B1_9MICO|nr:hypothetical protein [Protaetiibacter larvae]QEO09219.1 hypothetical protein FLP23_03850 [Protaetiibacter larvae]
MSERTPHPERVVGVFVAVSWAAVVFAVFGVLAVLLDRDPVDHPVGPLYGVAAIGVSVVVVYLGIVLTVPARRPWLGAITTAAGVYLAIVGLAALVDLSLAVAQAGSPFAAVAAVLAAAPPIVCWAVLHPARRARPGRAPR